VCSSCFVYETSCDAVKSLLSRQLEDPSPGDCHWRVQTEPEAGRSGPWLALRRAIYLGLESVRRLRLHAAAGRYADSPPWRLAR
jgi:hypothetical protein